MKSFSEFNKETVDEGVGLAVARAIDKTNPPLGRPSRRRAVSSALKMREVMKGAKKRKDEKGKSPVNFMQDKDYQKEDWQKKSGKNDEGGLNEKGRKSLRKRKSRKRS